MQHCERELHEPKADLIRSLMSRVRGCGRSVLCGGRRQGDCIHYGHLPWRFRVQEKWDGGEQIEGASKPSWGDGLHAVEAKAVVKVVARPQAAPSPPSSDGFSGVRKAGGKGGSPAKEPVPSALRAGFSGVFKSGRLEPAARPAAALKATASAQCPERAQGRLSSVHLIPVFEQLAGWELGVDAPHALSEHGQKMPNASQVTYQDSNDTVALCATGRMRSFWTACALGGQMLCKF